MDESHQIKQTIFTTADDDFRKVKDEDTNEEKFVGIYGVDENIGWGVVNKFAAFNGHLNLLKL